MSHVNSEIVDFYKNKSILLTGVTGFLGKLILQKLLRCCPEVKMIYVLIRQKKDKDSQKRIDDILSNPVFDRVKKEVPNYLEKIRVIPGDLQYRGLLIDEEDRQLLINEVNVVIHAAAVVNFTKTIKEMINTNVRGTKELLDLCEKMKDLSSVIVISTAYSFCLRKKIEECFMEPPIKPETIMSIVEEMNEDSLAKITPMLIGDWPNTYAFSKAIMEDIVKSRVGRLPIGLVRPSVVLPTYKDPVPSWSDSYNGSVGVTLATGIGILKVTWVNDSMKNDLIPGDYVTNACIVAAYQQHKCQVKRVPKTVVYNAVTSNKYALQFGRNYELCSRRYIPPAKVISPVYLYRTTNPVIYYTLDALLHRVPAAVLDCGRVIRGKKPFFWKLFSKVISAVSLTYYFQSREWDMKNENLMNMYDSLSEVDKKIFPFDVRSIDWEDFYETYPPGLLQYVMKEKMDEESREKATVRYQKLQRIYYSTVFIVLTIFFLLFAKLFMMMLS